MKPTKTEDEKMRMLTIFLPKSLIDALDKLVDENWASNRSELMRTLMFSGLMEFLKQIKEFQGLEHKIAENLEMVDKNA